MDTTEFFSTAIERYRILQQKKLGRERPWTEDPIFNTWRFCNVHREDDATTQWFAKSVRNCVPTEQALQATLIFRWFNRIEIGERILDLLLAKKWDGKEAFRRLEHVRPVVTGAYMLKTPEYYDKLEGVLLAIEEALPYLPMINEEIQASIRPSLEAVWNELIDIPYIGPFTGYEIVTDLRWTGLLMHATDINTWANPGPGCSKGLALLTGKKLRRHIRKDREVMIGYMRHILMESQMGQWPSIWPAWELREVEHWLCEYSKYKRAQNGDSLKRRYSVY